MNSNASTALVLAGGGVRGAYEVGIIEGIAEVMGLDGRSNPLFQIFTGTSVGALNAAYLVSHAERGDMAVDELVRIWTSFRIDEHLRIDPLGLWNRPRWARRGLVRTPPRPKIDERFGRSVLDPRPLEGLIRGGVAWEGLHRNIMSGSVKALIIAALEIATGRTALFAELAPGMDFRESRDPRRVAQVGPITMDHVLASAAIPIVFPARKVGSKYFCDGGLRFNTPIAPAIRAGADRLVVISVRHQAEEIVEEDHTLEYPSLPFLLGKTLNALLLDSIQYDLLVLERLNGLVEVLEETLPKEELQRVEQLLLETRGVPYRRLDTLVFSPSEDIGRIAQEVIVENVDRWNLDWKGRFLLEKLANSAVGHDADLASYLLFDGLFTGRLIELGRRDALSRAAQIMEFFSRPRNTRETGG